MAKLFTKLNLVWLAILLIAGFGVWLYVSSSSSDERSVAERQSGDSRAVTMIEYADLLCESCMEMHEETLPRIKTEYVESGHVDYTLKLVDVIAPDSLRAAQGAHCANEDGKYIEFVDASFQRLATDYHNRGINPLDSTIYSAARIGDIAETIGLERAPFVQCVEVASIAKLCSTPPKSFMI